MSDEVSAEDDEEAEQDEDDDSHHPSDHGVVHSRSVRHGCGGLRGGLWDGGGERRGHEKRRSLCEDQKTGVKTKGRDGENERERVNKDQRQ